MAERPGRCRALAAAAPGGPGLSGPAAPTAEATGRSELVSSLVLGALAFVIVTAETLPVGLISDIADGLHASTGGVGLAVGWYALFTAATGVPLTRFTSRLDRRTVLVGCAAAVVAAQLVAATAPSLAVFVAGRGLAALAHGVFFAVASPVLMRLARPQARDRVGARPAIGGSVALTAGTPLATLLGQFAGWRGATGAIAVVALVLAVAIWFVLPPLPALHGELPGQAGVLAAVRVPGVAVLFTVTAVAVAGHFSLFTYIEPFADGLGLSGAVFSAVLAGYGLSAVIGSMSAEWFGGRWPVAAARTAASLYTVAVAGIGVAGLLGSALLGVPLVVLWGGAFTLIFLTAWLGVLRRVPPAGAETAGALFNIVFQVGIVAGSALGAVFAGAGAFGALPLVAVATGLVVLGFAVSGRAYRGDVAAI